MIPATAFGAGSFTANFDFGSSDKNPYTVNVSNTEFTYDGANHSPTVVITDKDGQTVTPTTVKLKKGESEGVELNTGVVTEGTYKIMVTINGVEKEVGIFTIKKNSLTAAGIEIVNTTPVTADNLSTATSNAANYFKVTYGGIDIPAGDVILTCAQVSGTNQIKVTATNSTTGNFEASLTEELFYISDVITTYTIEEAVGDFEYTGAKMDPTLNIHKLVNSETVTLVKGRDYTVSCTDEIDVDQNVEVTITGINAFAGSSVKKLFKIKQNDLSTGSDVAISPNPLVFQKGDTTFNFTVTVGKRTLTRNVDYTLGSGFDATSTTDTGTTKTGTIIGTGKYKGNCSVSYKVVDANSKDLTAATISVNNLTYNGTEQVPTVTLKIGNNTVNSSCYVVKYRPTGSSSAFSTTKPKNAGTYDIEISQTSPATNGYTGTKTFTSAFSVNKLDLSNTSTVTATFSGSSSDPVIVKVGGNTLKRYTDYNVDSYNASKTIYTVTGTGSCFGTRTVYVSTRSISSCTINFSDNRSSVAYGSTYYPKVTAYYGSTKLYENTDYTLTYKNSKNQTVSYCRDTGTYTVIVTGTGAYTGTKTLYFTITGTDISNYTVTLKESSVTATGYSQTPVITSVKYGYYSSLSSNDYTVSYQDATGKTVYSMSAPGTYKVVVTGKNGYSGSTYATFRIVGLPQTVTVNQDSYKVYTTSDSFKITAKATGDGTGFTYTSSNPAVASVSAAGYVTIHKVGRAVITVTTTGNKKYEPTSKDVTVKVYPSKAKISQKPSTDGKKAQMKVRWGYQDGVTKYQVRYSRDKNFKSGSYLTKTVKAHGKSYTTQSTTISNLKSGYTYYFKVRAVYTDPYTGDTYYGSWSPWRSAKTK